ncbi:hypothetical protein NDI49_27050 [Trichocoleus sp. ST-U3]
MNDFIKSEDFYQRRFLEFIHLNKPDSAFVPQLALRYNIGKYERGKQYGMPDFESDIIEFDKDNKFHLWELKLWNSGEVESGKFLGQMMAYDFIFSTEPWNELAGRFFTKGNARNNGIKGEWQKAAGHLAFEYGSGGEYQEGDKFASFSSWNLVVCGGKGYELAAGFNPIIWHYYCHFPGVYLSKNLPSLKIFHFYQVSNGYDFRSIEELTIYDEGGLHPDADKAFNTDYPNIAR